MEIHEKRRAFHTFDGLRGAAALLVVTRHVGAMAESVSFPESFLAVDLFFALSGFVIAYAYGERIGRGGFLGEFLRIRLIRLYPLYFLGLVLGAIYRLGSIQLGTAGWTSGVLAGNLVTGMFMLSSALNGPTWTLMPELAANTAYAVSLKWLTTPVLIGLIVCGAIGLAGCEYVYGTLDLGWALSQAPVVVSRLLFSFFGGVLLFRVVGDRRRTRNWASCASVALVILLLGLSPPVQYRPFYELSLVLVGFPVVLWVACQSEPANAVGRLFRFLGVISYAVYTLHQPLSQLVDHCLSRVWHIQVEKYSPISLVVFLCALIVTTWIVDEWYDAPARRCLGRALLKRRVEEDAQALRPQRLIPRELRRRQH